MYPITEANKKYLHIHKNICIYIPYNTYIMRSAFLTRVTCLEQQDHWTPTIWFFLVHLYFISLGIGIILGNFYIYIYLRNKDVTKVSWIHASSRVLQAYVVKQAGFFKSKLIIKRFFSKIFFAFVIDDNISTNSNQAIFCILVLVYFYQF